MSSRPRPLITGIGCISPNGIGREAFGRACIAGQSGLKRPDPVALPDVRVPALGSIPAFAPEEVMDAVDLRRVPRTVPLALAAAREAMTQAGLAEFDQDVSRRTGLVLGTGGGGLAFVEAQYRGYFQDGRGSPFAITGGTHGNLAGELSIALGLRGPSHVLSTGCASSTDALGYAMLLIDSGRCDIVIVGGADAPIAPGILRGFERMGVVTTRPQKEPAFASRPFSRDRDGFVLGEGAWMFVVESSQSAASRDAKPLAVLSGYGSTSDAYHRVQIAPDVAECVRAMSIAIEDGALTPSDIDSVNLHGTSTEMNDRLETLAMHRLLGDRAKSVPMSTTKSLIGHPQGAGGAAGIAAAILAGRAGYVHPTLNLHEPAEDCDLDYVPLVARAVRPRHILCNCIAFGSKNSALVVSLCD